MMESERASSGHPESVGADTRHYLSNDYLLVELADTAWPGKPRFDRTGFITQVTLKEKNRTYCAYELDAPHPDAGGGLCGEYGIMRPIGYKDAEVGEWFPKLGVGLLRKPDDKPYNFFRDYDRLPFEILTDIGEHEARYIVLPKPHRGYALSMEKTVTLKDNTVTLHYLVSNCGEQPVDTHEYVHNFLRVDQYPVGPDYTLRLNFPFETIENESGYDPAVVRFDGDVLKWGAAPAKAFYFRMKPQLSGTAAGWELRHEPSGACVVEEVSAPLEMAAIWGVGHVVSPELFVTLRLAPGETASWTRKYRFE